MSKFKVGDEIVAIRTHSGGDYVKGEHYTVDGFTVCPNCGYPCIYLKGYNKIGTPGHTYKGCGWISIEKQRIFYGESNFEKLMEFSDAIEYKLKVSIPELTEIKELQNQ